MTPFSKALNAAVPINSAKSPTRMMCIGVHLSMHPDSFQPKGSGRDYKLTRLLEPIAHLKDDFSLFTNIDHPSIKGGHKASYTFLTGLKEKAISVDQMAAQRVGKQTRYASLQLSTGPQGMSEPIHFLSRSKSGVGLPAEYRADVMFRRLFIDGGSANAEKAKYVLETQGSILDLVMEDASSFKKSLGQRDIEKLDEYFTSVREVEKDVMKRREFLDKPKPKVEEVEVGTTFHENMEALLKIAFLAMQTDMTRVISMTMPGRGTFPIVADGFRGMGYHYQSHHGMEERKLQALLKIEHLHMVELGKFLDRLKNTEDVNGSSMLDNTMVLFGSGLGNGSSHSCRQLPVMLAGGGLKHGQCIRADGSAPLSNLYVSMLQRMGVDTDRFADSRGNFNNELGV
ncbi:MAG: DUF1552 domain-containing protein [Verrucomicrobiota bacterium]